MTRLLIALAFCLLAAPTASADILSCDYLKGDCLQRGVTAAICQRNMKSAHLTGHWPAFRRGKISIPARACR